MVTLLQKAVETLLREKVTVCVEYMTDGDTIGVYQLGSLYHLYFSANGEIYFVLTTTNKDVLLKMVRGLALLAKVPGVEL